MIHFISDDEYEQECRELRLDRQHRLRYLRQLANHPHPNDPDHPGTTTGEDDEDQDK